VNHIYEPAELIPAAEAMAKKIIANGPLAVKFTMEAIERGVEMAQEEGCSGSDAFRSGLRDRRHAGRYEGVFGEAASAIQREVKEVNEVKEIKG